MSLAIVERWDTALGYAKERVTPALYDTWFGPTAMEVLAWEGDAIELGVTNLWIKEWVEKKYLPLLADALRHAGAENPQIRLSISPRLYQAHLQSQRAEAGENADAIPVPDAIGLSAPVDDLGLHPDYRLDTFVATGQSRLAHAAFARAAEHPGEYNPLVVHGPSGSGKSHLLQGLCRLTRERRPRARVIYVAADRFVNEYTAAFAAGKLESFRRRYQSVDLLAVDEFQAFGMGKKIASQAEFAALIDHLLAAGRQVALASSEAVDRMELSGSLRSRLAGGLAARLESPDAEARTEILRAKTARRGLTLPPSTLRILAEESRGCVRELEGMVQRLAALVALDGMALTPMAARMALDRRRPVDLERTLSLADVAEATAAEFSISAGELLGRGRSLNLRTARALAWWISRRVTGASLSELGDYYGGRAHATVLSALKSFPSERLADPLAARPAERILRRLGTSVSAADLAVGEKDLFAGDKSE